MILSLIVIVLVGVIAYIWASRGFFSSLVHMLCVLIAGAIALGVWEPVAYWMLGKNGVSEMFIDMAWGVSLAVPFAAVLAVLRLATNKLLPSNADLDGVTNLVGGGLCGVVSGIISVGILILSVNFLRVPQEFAGMTPIDFDNNGSLKRNEKLWFPVDRITSSLYAYLSDGALHTATPLAAYRPTLADDGALLRANFNSGGSRHTFSTTSFEVLGRYTVGPTGNEQRPSGTKPEDLLTDVFLPDKKQNVTNLDGEKINPDGHIEGFIVHFLPGAKEKNGNIIVGNGQLQLVCRNTEDTESISLQPFAMISQEEAASRDLGRWRFDAPRNFFRSAGGASEASMAFEFLVPRGYTALALYVKGLRTDVTEMKPYARYGWTKERDDAIKSGNLINSIVTGSDPLDDSTAVKMAVDPAADTAEVVLNPNLISTATTISILNKDNLKGLEIDEERKIVNGSAKFSPNEVNGRGLDRNLQVKQFSTTEDTKIVQVRVGVSSRIGMLKPAALAADFSKPPVLIDSSGQRYAAVGYVYKEQAEYDITFLPGKPVARASELPPLSGSRQDQELILVYRVSAGAKLVKYAIGNKTVAIFTSPIQVPGEGQ